MIGTQIRSISQLYRLAKEHLNGVHGFSIRHDSCVEFCAFPCKKENKVAVMPITNGCNTNLACNPINLDAIKESHHQGVLKQKEIFGHSNAYITSSLDITTMGMRHPLAIGGITILVEDGFNEEYKNFLASNPKIVSSVIGRYITSDYSIGKLLYIISNGNVNFWAWAVKMVCRYHVSIFTIKHLFEFNNDYSQLVKNITKGNFIALSNNQETTKALEEVFALRAQATAKQAINWFNPVQKKLLRDKLSSKDAVDILNNFTRLSKTKRINFIRKVSTISDVDEILKMMSFLCSNSHFNWDKDSLLTFIENVETINCEVVFNQNNIVIVKVQDYETVKRLGKTTNWCISKNLQYWEQYMNNRGMFNDDNLQDSEFSGRVDLSEFESGSPYDKKFIKLITNQISSSSSSNTRNQFIVFDFNEKEDSKESIVGITITNNKISHAHNFVNDNMLGQLGRAPRDIMTNWEEILTNLWSETNGTEEDTTQMTEQDIDLFLSRRNLNLSVFQNTIHSDYEWTKEGVKSWMSQFIDEDEIDMWYEDESKLIFRSNSRRALCLLPNIIKFLQITSHSDDVDEMCGFVFCLDFAKNENDGNRILLWSIIENHEIRTEDVRRAAFNIYGNTIIGNFEKMLTEFSLPFNIIRRPNNLSQKLFVAVREQNTSLFFNILDEIKETQYPLIERDKSQVFRFISNKIDSCNLSIIKTLVENYNLIDLIGKEHVLGLLDRIFNLTIREFHGGEINPRFTLLSKFEDLNQFKTDYMQSLLNFPDKHCDRFIHKVYEAKTTITTMGYCTLFFYLIEAIDTTKFPSFYNKLIPKIVNNIISNGLVDTRSVVITNIVEKLFNEYGSKIDALQIRDMQNLFRLLQNDNYATFVFNQLDKFLSNADLHTRHISRLISDLRDIYSFVNESTYTKCLNKICQVAQHQHIISEETAKQIVTAKH